MSITDHDIKKFLRLETDLSHAVAGMSNWRMRFYLKLFLWDGRFFMQLRHCIEWMAWLRERGAFLVGRLRG